MKHLITAFSLSVSLLGLGCDIGTDTDCRPEDNPVATPETTLSADRAITDGHHDRRSEKNTPQAVALSFIDAMRTGDVRLLKSVLTPSDLHMLGGDLDELLKMVLQKASRELADITTVEIVDSWEYGKLATVLVSCDGELVEVNLIQVNGHWKVRMDD